MRRRQWTIGGAALTMALVAILSLSVESASARLGGFKFVSSFGRFFSTEGIAIDESTNDVYVFTPAGSIEKFDADGNPIDFSALGTNSIKGVGNFGFNETELAVDNSSGPAKGDIYLAAVEEIKIFGPDGKAIGKITQATGQPWGEACGVAVDGSGRVYVGLYPSVVNVYTPTAEPVVDSDYTRSFEGLNEVCNVAADPEGNVYVDTWMPSRKGPIVKYGRSGESRQITASGGGTMAVLNAPTAELFVDSEKEVRQFDSTGNLIGSFGSEQGHYFAVAVNAKNDRLYVADVEQNSADPTTEQLQIWQGEIVPTVHTLQAGHADPSGGITLEGSVNPEGTMLETCYYEYGTSVSYGATVPCEQATPIGGDAELPLSADISSLALNHPYHFRLVLADSQNSFDGVDKTFEIAVKPAVEDAPPAASSPERTSVKLSGVVNPEQVDASYRFEYGTTESYGLTTPVGRVDASNADVPVEMQLGELLPNATYHYRLVATNSAGESIGADHTFTTGAATPPVVVTGGALGITQNSATIAGEVNTSGLPTMYGFEIGTSTDYGPPTGLGAVATGASEAAATLALTGLQPGTTYHYRLTATNVDGTVYGADETFTTSTFASTFAEPPAPLPFVSIPPIGFPTETGSQVHKPAKKAKAKAKKKRTRGKRKKLGRKRKG